LDVIIKLIIRILEEIFAQDTKRRTPQAQTGPQGSRPQSSQAGARRPVDNSDLLTRVLQDIEELPPHAARNRGAVAAFPPPIPVSDPGTESLAEHLAELTRRDEARELEMEERLHLEHKLIHQDLQDVLAPVGRTPLEQMIVACVILGPCKAQMRDPRMRY